MDDAHVLVMSFGADESLLAPALARLADDGLSVVVGPNLGGYPSVAQLSDAAVVLVAVGGSAWPVELTYPIEEFARRGQVVVVGVDANSRAPSTRNDLVYFDLGAWAGGPSATFDALTGHLRALVNSGLHRHVGPQLESQVEYARTGVVALQELAAQIGQLAEVLADDAEQSLPLRETLAEISGTYRVVKSAVESFVAAGLETGGPSGAAYARLAHGLLAQAIRNGRGHCTRIGTRYERVGGLRDSIKGRLSQESLAELDETFERLANADDDVFSAMDQLGAALTDESRVIVSYLSTQRIDEARERMTRARDRLLPLERALDEALAAFQDVESVLGYAEPVPQEKEVVQVTSQTITILGDVVNSNVVAAETIEHSSIIAAESPIQKDLKAALLELHKATATLTSHLPDDEAALAARDVEDLTKEATSRDPRPAFWRRAAEGLLAAAKKGAEAGTPVIELVTKVTSLLG
jgi:hypothetical protein